MPDAVVVMLVRVVLDSMESRNVEWRRVWGVRGRRTDTCSIPAAKPR